jgi:hypothetical protein
MSWDEASQSTDQKRFAHLPYNGATFGNLAGEWVQVMQLEQRLQVYYCTTLIREIDLGIQRSTMVERWIPS